MSYIEVPPPEATATIHSEGIELVQDSLRLAIENEELAVVAHLLENNIEPSVFDIDDAVKRSSYPILDLLLSMSGFEINTPLRQDYPPPLADALFDPELIRWLVAHGADPNARSQIDITPLSIAAQSAPKEILELLFELGASTEFGQPLHYAVACERPDEIVEMILERGAAINKVMYQDDPVSYNLYKDLGLKTPLHQAAEIGNSRLVELLLKHGADPGVPDTLGNLPELSAEPGLRGGQELEVSAVQPPNPILDSGFEAFSRVLNSG